MAGANESLRYSVYGILAQRASTAWREDAGDEDHPNAKALRDWAQQYSRRVGARPGLPTDELIEDLRSRRRARLELLIQGTVSLEDRADELLAELDERFLRLLDRSTAVRAEWEKRWDYLVGQGASAFQRSRLNALIEGRPANVEAGVRIRSLVTLLLTIDIMDGLIESIHPATIDLSEADLSVGDQFVVAVGFVPGPTGGEPPPQQQYVFTVKRNGITVQRLQT